MHSVDLQKTRKAKAATKAIFLICGLAISSWAPMVPYAKDRLHLNDADLGLLLLFLGAGAIIMMPVSGILSRKVGSRIVILAAGWLMALSLPLLMVMNSFVPMAVILFIFGAAVGTTDVAMNAHGVQVQNHSAKPIMSSLHGLFSVGGLLGSLGLGFLIKAGLAPISAAIAISAMLAIIVSWQFPKLFDAATERAGEYHNDVAPDSGSTRRYEWLNRKVLFLGAMCFIAFLAEGAMLDWSAVFLRENRGVDAELAGVGYAAFSIAMAAMRLPGDKLVSRLNGRTVVIAGSLIAAAGFILAIITPWFLTAIIGFVLIGLGAANIVPVFFSEGGRIKGVPSAIAITAITTLGYTGQLAGPAMLGLIANWSTLPVAIGFCGVLMALIAVFYGLKKGT